MLIILFVSSLPLVWTHIHSSHQLSPLSSGKGSQLSQHIAKLLFEEREVLWGLDAGDLEQLVELNVKITARSQTTTYLKALFLCLQAPPVGASPHKLGLALPSSYLSLCKLRHKLSCPVQSQERALLVPLHLFPSPAMVVLLETQADIFLQMHF